MPRPHREAPRGTKNKGCVVNWCILSFLGKSLLPTLVSLPCSVVAGRGLPCLFPLGFSGFNKTLKPPNFLKTKLIFILLRAPKEPRKPVIFMKGGSSNLSSETRCFRAGVHRQNVGHCVFRTASRGQRITAAQLTAAQMPSTRPSLSLFFLFLLLLYRLRSISPSSPPPLHLCSHCSWISTALCAVFQGT